MGALPSSSQREMGSSMSVEELALKTWTIDSVIEKKAECEAHLQVVDRIGGRMFS